MAVGGFDTLCVEFGEGTSESNASLDYTLHFIGALREAVQTGFKKVSLDVKETSAESNVFGKSTRQTCRHCSFGQWVYSFLELHLWANLF